MRLYGHLKDDMKRVRNKSEPICGILSVEPANVCIGAEVPTSVSDIRVRDYSLHCLNVISSSATLVIIYL